MKPVLTPLSPQRQRWGWAIAIVGLPLDHGGVHPAARHGRAHQRALAVPRAGDGRRPGRWRLPAVVAVIGGFVLANWYFTPPFHELAIAHGENLLALVVYVFAAGTSPCSSTASAQPDARRTLPGRGGSAGGARRVTHPSRYGRRDGRSAPRHLRHARQPSSPATATSWRTLVSSGVDPHAIRSRRTSVETSETTSSSPSPAAIDIERGPARPQRVRRPPHRGRRERPAADRGRQGVGPGGCEHAARVAAASRVARPAHPLASIKASISSLRQRDIDWAPDDIDEFQRTIEEETDRLTDGRQPARHEPTPGVSARSRAAPHQRRGGRARRDRQPRDRRSRVELDVPESLPDVSADPALLTRHSPTWSATPCATPPAPAHGAGHRRRDPARGNTRVAIRIDRPRPRDQARRPRARVPAVPTTRRPSSRRNRRRPRLGDSATSASGAGGVRVRPTGLTASATRKR